MGVQHLLVCRRELSEAAVYELTKQFFVALPKLSALDSTMRHLDVDQRVGHFDPAPRRRRPLLP